MILITLTFALGAFWGARLAKKRGGNRSDMAQYGVAYGIVFGLVGLFFVLFLSHLL